MLLSSQVSGTIDPGRSILSSPVSLGLATQFKRGAKMLALSNGPAASTMPASAKKFPFKVHGRTPTVLFIDDDANFCKCFRRRFHRSGLRFCDAQTGLEGYRLATEL